MLKKVTAGIVSLIMALSMLTVCYVSVLASETTFPCTPSATDNGANGWWLGTNVTVTPTSGSGFTMASKDGTAVNANVIWIMTVAQLKKTPNFNIKIGNTGAADGGPYLRMYYGVGSAVEVFQNPGFLDSNLQNWVRANTKTGLHTFDMTEQINSLTDNDAIWLVLYVDPSGTNAALKVDELYLSEKNPATSSNGSGNHVADTGVNAVGCIFFAFLLLSASAAVVVLAKKRAQ